jgi:hypothetical protein
MPASAICLFNRARIHSQATAKLEYVCDLFSFLGGQMAHTALRLRAFLLCLAPCRSAIEPKRDLDQEMFRSQQKQSAPLCERWYTKKNFVIASTL